MSIMSENNRQKWRQSPFSYKNGLYLMYHVAKGRRNKNRPPNDPEFLIEELVTQTITDDDGPLYRCSMCAKIFNLLSSFLLHVYRHSDPYAIQKDIKKEEELEEQKLNKNDVFCQEGTFVKKEEEDSTIIKIEQLKTETPELSSKPEISNNEPNQLPDDLPSSSNLVDIQPKHSFMCNYCNARFNVKNLLKQHLQLHRRYFNHQHQKTQNIEKCDICSYESHSKENLKEHYFTSHKRSSRICRVCTLNLGSNALRRVHERYVHGIEGNVCLVCRLGYKTLDEARMHLNELHEKEVKCIICQHEFNLQGKMLHHCLKTHRFGMTKVEEESLRLLTMVEKKNINSESLTDDRIKDDCVTCKYCNKPFLNEKLARLHETRQHLTSKEDDPGYTCNICGTSFSKRANGLRHARRMHGSRINKGDVSSFSGTILNHKIDESRFSCDQCEKTFLNSSALISHSRKAHVSQELVYQCGICDKKLKSFGTLRDHIEAVHEKKLTYFCDICGKGHARKSGLRTHMKVNHISIRDFVCPICQLRFAQLNQLNVHQKIHSTKKLHTCHICQKSFAQLSGLSQHMAMHSDNPKYSCNICNLTFKYASSFYNHRKSHVSPQTEHKCHECNRICPSRFSLYVHRKTHHATITQQFDCSECGKVFKRKNTLKYHILNKHTPHVNYKCDYCDNEGFKTKRDRKRHMNTIHMQLI